MNQAPASNTQAPVCAYCRQYVQQNQQPVACPQCQSYSHGPCWQKAGNCPMCIVRHYQAQQAQQAPGAQQAPTAPAQNIAGLQLQAPPTQQPPMQAAAPIQGATQAQSLEIEEEIPVLGGPTSTSSGAPQSPKMGLEIQDISEDDVEIDLSLRFEAVRRSERIRELRADQEQELVRGLALSKRRERFEIFSKKLIVGSICGWFSSLVLLIISLWLVILSAMIIITGAAIIVIKRKQILEARENQVDVNPIPVRVEEVGRGGLAILGLDVTTTEAPADFIPVQDSNVERLIGIQTQYLSKKALKTGDMGILIADDGYALHLESFEHHKIVRMAKTTKEFQNRYQKMISEKR
jgi:hypothetical protein